MPSIDEMIDEAIRAYAKHQAQNDDEDGRVPTREHSSYTEEGRARAIVDLGDEDGPIGASYIFKFGSGGHVEMSGPQRRPV